MSSFKPEDVKEIAVIGCVDGDDFDRFILARLTAHETSDFEFSPKTAVGGCIALYEAFLGHVPESMQNEFEEFFLEDFEKSFRERHDRMEFFRGDGEQD